MNICGFNPKEGDIIADILVSKDLREGYLLVYSVWDGKIGKRYFTHMSTQSYYHLKESECKIEEFKTEKETWEAHEKLVEEIKNGSHRGNSPRPDSPAREIQEEN